MASIVALLNSIIGQGGLMSLFTFLSLMLNFGFIWFIYTLIKREQSKVVTVEDHSIPTVKLPSIMEAYNKEQIEQIENLLEIVKKELELMTMNEHQPMREMLLKITSSIELLAKTIEYAANSRNK